LGEANEPKPRANPDHGNTVVWETLSLDLTFYPSFTLPYLERVERESWVVTAGVFKGGMLRVTGRTLEYRGVPDTAVEYIAGFWLDPSRLLRELPRSARLRAESIVEAYSELGLAISPFDRTLIFISVFLSRSTDFHRNTVRWCRSIASLLEAGSPLDSTTLKALGSSYHLKQLPEALTLYYSTVKPLEDRGAPVEEVRRALMKIRYVGAKTAIAYLLFTDPRASHLAPYDTHFKSMIERLDLLSKPYVEPNSRYCRIYSCDNCPIGEGCAVKLASEMYGRLAGWIQTACYLHDKLYCRRGLCNECKLRSLCRART